MENRSITAPGCYLCYRLILSCKVFSRFTWEKKQEQYLVTNLYYFSTDPARSHLKMAEWTLSWEVLIKNKFSCESEFQGACLLKDKPEHFKWKYCLLLRMLLFPLKCRLIYLGQNLCQVLVILSAVIYWDPAHGKCAQCPYCLNSMGAF